MHPVLLELVYDFKREQLKVLLQQSTYRCCIVQAATVRQQPQDEVRFSS